MECFCFFKNELEKTIFKLVLSEKLDKIDLKKQIKLISKQNKDTGKFKNYIIKQLLENRINCTEGLLLYGYKTDAEATELRKKYCH